MFGDDFSISAGAEGCTLIARNVFLATHAELAEGRRRALCLDRVTNRCPAGCQCRLNIVRVVPLAEAGAACYNPTTRTAFLGPGAALSEAAAGRLGRAWDNFVWVAAPPARD